MNNTTHTPEPWKFNPDHPDWTKAHHDDWLKQQAEESRTRACVNACVGIKDPETMVPELIAAIRGALPVIKDEESARPAPEWSAIRREFESVLAKLEGGTK